VVVGIGFLGAGVIMRRNGEVANLTTAASIWAVAAIGVAAGVGDVGTATIATVVTLGYLVALRPVRRWLERTAAQAHCLVAVTLAPGAAPDDVVARVDGVDGVAVRLRSVEKRDGRLVAMVDIRGRPEAAVCTMTARLASLSEVTDMARQ